MTQSLENISILYNEYNEAYNNLLKKIKNSELSILKLMLTFKLTERDEIKLTLFENKRLSMNRVIIDNDTKDQDEFILDINSCSKTKTFTDKDESKDNVDLDDKSSNINKDGLHNRHNKSKLTKSIIEVEGKDELQIINPIKMIHGGFVSPSFKNSQQDVNLVLVEIINVVNKKRKILKLLDDYEQKK